MSNTKKNLLNENTIRRFMKLAEIDELSDGFVDGLVQETKITVKEQEVEEAEEPTMEEQEEFDVAPEEGPADGPSGMGDEEGLDMAPEEAPDAMAGGEAAALTDAVAALMGVISDMTGVDIAVDGAEEEADMPADDDLAVADVGMEDEVDVMAEDTSSTATTQEESLQRDADYREALKQEVYRRVAGRLHEEHRKDALADQLSDRILARIKEQSKK